jgi:hypothetical protein
VFEEQNKGHRESGSGKMRGNEVEEVGKGYTP